MSTGQVLGNKNLAYYCQRFSDLNVSNNRQRGKANYKPILLLSVIDLISQGLIQDNQIPVSDQLIEIFNQYWDILGSASYNGGLHYPFIHLQSEGFWHITPKAGWNGPKPKTNNKVREAVEYASLDDELFNLLQEPASRTELIDTLVAVWFSDSQKELEELLQINQNFQNYNDEDVEDASALLDKTPKFILRKSLVRKAFFRKAVVQTYNYKCVFCKLKVTKSLTQNIVDAAHIKQISQFYENNINNGISLCKNHHWAFDRGWFSIDDEYRILVASDLQEESPNARPMQDFRNEQIILPSSEKDFPSLEALQWHRLNIFRA